MQSDVLVYSQDGFDVEAALVLQGLLGEAFHLADEDLGDGGSTLGLLKVRCRNLASSFGSLAWFLERKISTSSSEEWSI